MDWRRQSAINKYLNLTNLDSKVDHCRNYLQKHPDDVEFRFCLIDSSLQKFFSQEIKDNGILEEVQNEIAKIDDVDVRSMPQGYLYKVVMHAAEHETDVDKKIAYYEKIKYYPPAKKWLVFHHAMQKNYQLALDSLYRIDTETKNSDHFDFLHSWMGSEKGELSKSDIDSMSSNQLYLLVGLMEKKSPSYEEIKDGIKINLYESLILQTDILAKDRYNKALLSRAELLSKTIDETPHPPKIKKTIVGMLKSIARDYIKHDPEQGLKYYDQISDISYIDLEANIILARNSLSQGDFRFSQLYYNRIIRYYSSYDENEKSQIKSSFGSKGDGAATFLLNFVLATKPENGKTLKQLVNHKPDTPLCSLFIQLALLEDLSLLKSRSKRKKHFGYDPKKITNEVISSIFSNELDLIEIRREANEQ
tara:strand:- start:26981 stop:28240 length:1260 start_codon:yes stop_codon:yes gene_type:complete